MSRPFFLFQWKLPGTSTLNNAVHFDALQCACKSSFFCINAFFASMCGHYESGDCTTMTSGTRIMRLILHKLQGDG